MHVGPMPGSRIDATMRLGKAHAMDWHGQTLEASGAYRVCLPGPASQQACGLVASRLEARVLQHAYAYVREEYGLD
jgi:hypothetical protein